MFSVDLDSPCLELSIRGLGFGITLLVCSRADFSCASTGPIQLQSILSLFVFLPQTCRESALFGQKVRKSSLRLTEEEDSLVLMTEVLVTLSFCRT